LIIGEPLFILRIQNHLLNVLAISEILMVVGGIGFDPSA
jgi:hypothetical protein